MTTRMLQGAGYLFAAALLIFSGYPFVFMAATSFKTQQQFFAAPFSLVSDMRLDNYGLAFRTGLDRYFLNTLLITSAALVVIVLLSALASYPLSRMRLRYGKLLLMLFVSGMMLPIHSTLIPVFKLTRDMGLYDSLWALLGPYVAFSLPVSIFILTGFMSELPRELDEAAEIDGCSHAAIFCRITLPLILPALSTIVIYNFVHIWNEFIFSLVLISSPEHMTLPLGMQKFFGDFTVNVPALMAALTLSSLPMLLIYIAAQEKIVKGLVVGAVK